MKKEPDPLDPNDPRVLVEWKDKLGQIIRPGDYIAAPGWKTICIGKVLMIRATRKDGKAFTKGGPHFLIHLCNAVVPNEPLMRDRPKIWDVVNRQYVPNPLTDQIPVTHEFKNHNEIVKVGWKYGIDTAPGQCSGCGEFVTAYCGWCADGAES